jgi:hypothetical protein
VEINGEPHLLVRTAAKDSLIALSLHTRTTSRVYALPSPLQRVAIVQAVGPDSLLVFHDRHNPNGGDDAAYISLATGERLGPPYCLPSFLADTCNGKRHQFIPMLPHTLVPYRGGWIVYTNNGEHSFAPCANRQPFFVLDSLFRILGPFGFTTPQLYRKARTVCGTHPTFILHRGELIIGYKCNDTLQAIHLHTGTRRTVANRSSLLPFTPVCNSPQCFSGDEFATHGARDCFLALADGRLVRFLFLPNPQRRTAIDHPIALQVFDDSLRLAKEFRLQGRYSQADAVPYRQGILIYNHARTLASDSLCYDYITF